MGGTNKETEPADPWGVDRGHLACNPGKGRCSSGGFGFVAPVVPVEVINELSTDTDRTEQSERNGTSRLN